MNSLFDSAQNAAYVARLSRLRPDTKPLWGKMDAGRMVAHCRQPLRVATGDLPLKRGWIGWLFGGMAKRKLLSGKPYGRNMPTHPLFKLAPTEPFDAELAALIAQVRRFAEVGEPILVRTPHPFFGPLTPREWDELQACHLEHHLQQFGL